MGEFNHEQRTGENDQEVEAEAFRAPSGSLPLPASQTSQTSSSSHDRLGIRP